MSGDRFEIESETYFEEPKSSGGCARGCLAVAVVVLAIFVAGSLWIYMKWRDWAADFGTDMIAHMVEQSEWNQQEKGEVMVQVKRVADAFRDGKLTGDQLRVVGEEMIASPLWTTMAVAAIEIQYVKNSGLTEEEKTAGRATLRRFVRGMMDGTLGENEFDETISSIATKKDDGTWQMKESATDDELRALFKKAKEKVDAAEIPEEVEEVDPSDELQRIIDKALGEGGEAEPVAEEAPAE